jgi:hypothetical protein
VTADRPHRERRAPHGRDKDRRAGRDGDAGPADGAPALAGEPDVADLVQTSDEIEREHFLPDQAPVDTWDMLALVMVREGRAHAAADQQDPGCGDDHRGCDLHGHGS